MVKSTIQLTYLQVIDHTATGHFERTVFNQSFNEFAIKCQEYNPGAIYFSLAAMIAANPKANSLHYKTALSIGGTMKGLNNMIPGLCDILGTKNILFEKFQFEIIGSNPFNQAEHTIAITYTTGYFHLLKIIDGLLLLASESDNCVPDDFQQTFMLAMQPGLSVTACQPSPITGMV